MLGLETATTILSNSIFSLFAGVVVAALLLSMILSRLLGSLRQGLMGGAVIFFGAFTFITGCNSEITLFFWVSFAAFLAASTSFIMHDL